MLGVSCSKDIPDTLTSSIITPTFFLVDAFLAEAILVGVVFVDGIRAGSGILDPSAVNMDFGETGLSG
jgi:hypothetical protein